MLSSTYTQLRSAPISITIRNTLARSVMRTISLRLDADSDALLRTLCARLGLTQTDVIRKALESLTVTAVSPGMLGAELGLPGFFASGVSTNAADHSAAIKAKLAKHRSDQRLAPTAAHSSQRTVLDT